MMVTGAGWTMVLGDCLDVMRDMADQSVDLSLLAKVAT